MLATRGNLNNHIGVPLTLLELRSAHRYAVVEMGMNHAGEISYITRLAEPDVALINNAGVAHIENLGSTEAIARAKGEIFEGLRPGGTAVINADDRYAPLWRESAAGKRQLEFALVGPGRCDRHLPDTRSRQRNRAPHAARNRAVRWCRRRACTTWATRSPRARRRPRSRCRPETVAAGLARFGGVKGRLQRKSGLNGATLIDDTYNANPDSVRAAIAVLARLRGKKLLVLGDMGELGRDAAAMHAQVGEFARAAGVAHLYTLGELSAHATQAFGAGARHFTRIEDLLAEIENALAPDVTMLVKGSRFMQMERVVKRLRGDDAETARGDRGGAAVTQRRSLRLTSSRLTRNRRLRMLLELVFVRRSLRAALPTGGHQCC